ncbi:MAG: hypothetical protein SNJ74_05350, partial [Fimbriimonadaceae bacterium]
TLFDREGRVILRGQQMLNLTPGNSILSMAMGGEQPGPRPAPPHSRVQTPPSNSPPKRPRWSASSDGSCRAI